MIVTIDGPAGSGKSTVAQLLAQRLGFQFLDTGAMYRAVALAAMESSLNVADQQAIGEVAARLNLEFEGERVMLDGRDVTVLIRAPEVSQNASIVAEIPQVREELVKRQREIAAHGNYVCEGRDQGTVAFPNADCKIFLTASIQIRAERRWRELRQAGCDLSLDEVITEQNTRDIRDRTRPVGSLQKAADAVEVVTDGKSVEEIVDQLEQLVRQTVSRLKQEHGSV